MQSRLALLEDALLLMPWLTDGGSETFMVAYPFSHYLWDYVLLWHTLAAVSLTAQMDRFTWKWTTTGEYTAASAYRIMHEGHTHTPGVRRVWRSWAPQRVKFFTWLALKRRLWTKVFLTGKEKKPEVSEKRVYRISRKIIGFVILISDEI